MALQRTLPKLLKLNGLKELSTCAKLNQHRNPRDPISWASNSQIPLPSTGFQNYDPDVRAGK